jgi:hypothetical protein
MKKKDIIMELMLRAYSLILIKKKKSENMVR